jgi:hypothetical protein
MQHGRDAAMDNAWFQWDAAHFDAMPKDVREAIRNYPDNINCGRLFKMARTKRELLTILAEGRAPICDGSAPAAESAPHPQAA